MINVLVVIVLIIFSALFSGLTLGLMSLNTHELKRKMQLGNKDAAKVYKVRKKGNLLLTTLLIGNVAVNSVLAIFLGSIAPGVIAGLIATGLIVIFGEIMPQAIFSRYALKLGAKVSWLVQIFIYILYPISYPIAWVLNKTLGEELQTIYSKKELMKIIEEHEDSKHSDIDVDEERIVKGALTFSGKFVKDVMTPRSVLLRLDYDTKLDEATLEKLRSSSYSRYPVYKENHDNIVGILYVKQLLRTDIYNKTVGQIADKKVTFIAQDSKLDVVFNSFISTHVHLYVVRDEFNSVMGVVTLEDILEEIIDDEIMDEDDKHENLRKFAREIKRND